MELKFIDGVSWAFFSLANSMTRRGEETNHVADHQITITQGQYFRVYKDEG